MKITELYAETFGRCGVALCLAMLVNQTDFYQNYNPLDIFNLFGIGFGFCFIMMFIWLFLPFNKYLVEGDKLLDEKKQKLKELGK